MYMQVCVLCKEFLSRLFLPSAYLDLGASRPLRLGLLLFSVLLILNWSYQLKESRHLIVHSTQPI